MNVILSPETKLPAKVRVPIPTGAVLLWSGEILGGDVADDPSREASITATADGLVVEFTLEKVRVAQVEAQWKAPTIAGNKVTSDLEWVNTTEAGTYTFAVRLPAGATNVKISPAEEGAPNTNADGETLHTLTPVRLEQGAKFPISISYETGNAAGGSSSGLSPILIGAIVLLVIAVVALVVVVVRQGSSAPASIPEISSTRRSGRTAGDPKAEDSAADTAPEHESTEPDDASEDDAFTWD